MKWLLGLAGILILAFALAACGDDEGANGEGGDADDGQKVAQAQCFTCHTTDGRPLVGPSWKGLYNSQVELESGETVTADDAYLRESILQPNAKVVKGYPPSMPPFQGILSDEQIEDIIAYIKTLE